jgi:hypothetical protein
MNDPLDIQDYLDASSEASKRARTMLIIMVVASVLMIAGLLNSLQSSWMLGRIKTLDYNGMHSHYAETKLGEYPTKQNLTEEEYKKSLDLYTKKYEELNTALIRAYVDNSLTIRVPFFGFSFDVNDLGLLGGLGFLVILGCLRFCLSREVENLNLSFEHALKLGRLNEFYHLLAMKQVFTVPITEHIRRTKFLLIAPKLVCFLPIIVYGLVTFNDFQTNWIGHQLSEPRIQYLLIYESITIILMSILTSMIVHRLVRLDEIWRKYSPHIPISSKTTSDPVTS